jgi:methylphosphotriester-DNA--protein-cysteine methyltransferase
MSDQGQNLLILAGRYESLRAEYARLERDTLEMDEWITRLETGLERIANGDIPWSDGLSRAGSLNISEFQAFARSVLGKSGQQVGVSTDTFKHKPCLRCQTEEDNLAGHDPALD